jgi:hypothetical protein
LLMLVLRALGVVLGISYLAFLALAWLMPACEPGFEVTGAICFIGERDYGFQYHLLFWLSVKAMFLGTLGLVAVAPIVALLLLKKSWDRGD